MCVGKKWTVTLDGDWLAGETEEEGLESRERRGFGLKLCVYESRKEELICL